MCKDSLPACIFVHYLNAWCLLRPEEGIRSPGTGIAAVTCHVGHWKDSKYSQLLSCLSTPHGCYFF